MRAVLVSTYDLGHQPFALASAAAWLEAEGCRTRLIDLAVEPFDETVFRSADLIGFHLPMHTATRLAIPLIRKLRVLEPQAHLCAFGLYAPMNREPLRRLGVDSVIGGEFEAPLSWLCRRAEDEISDAPPNAVWLHKQRFKQPLRAGLPELSSYAHLTLPDGGRKEVGYTEASRGCKHRCRHCPIVPVYGGRFFVVQQDVVLADIRQQVAAGAAHISFGDPDFFNGVGHARGVVEAMRREFPELTYDVTIKIEHLLKYAYYLPLLRDTGCLFVTSAVESVDDHTLSRLAKGHSRADFIRVTELFRGVGLVLAPTFVAFSPWMTLDGYLDLLQVIEDCELVENVAPVQLAIRLLIPAGSRLLELPEIRERIGSYDGKLLCFPWTHSDARIDRLHAKANEIVQDAAEAAMPRQAVFDAIRDCAEGIGGHRRGRSFAPKRGAREAVCCPAIPQMSENWYCCAEPTNRQLNAY
ncbi:MAG TPA: CUAEP/CCAEP-tail radical SAM protein [Stellaceae bacterium]|nr:CUAEP/CCAEP-tail radical SAM protein [Stellaceae bacterium]